MPALPFQKNLIQSVMDGSKPGTVRQLRKKYPIKAGDTLYLFTGMRTKQCKKHGSHVCVKVYPIKVNWKTKTIELDGVTLVPIIRHWFATTDIQGSEQEFFDFFQRMNYKRKLVYICWSYQTVQMIDEFLASAKSKV